MDDLIPGVTRNIQEFTNLDEIGFDFWCREYLAFQLERRLCVLIPDNEVDQWKTFGDILTTVNRYTR